MHRDKLNRIIQSYFAAWNRSDAKAVAGFFSEHGVYVDTALNQEYRGDGIRQYVQKVLSETRGTLSFRILEAPVINDDVVFLRSSLTVSYEGTERQFESAELFKFFNSQLILVQTYYDLGHEKDVLVQNDEKYAKSGLDANGVNDIKRRLESLMESQKPYKDPSLKLQDLSDLLDIRRNQLSLILNVEYQMKFFDFINKYRLEAFISELHKCADREINITSLAYDVGFSSSSVFYKIFKRYQDISPRQYIKNHNLPPHLG